MKKIWDIVFTVLLILICIYGVKILDFLFVKTCIKSGNLQIIYDGTSSMGSNASYYISDDTVIAETERIDKRFLMTEKKFGWRFKPLKSGNCTIIVEKYDCADLTFVEIYDISVDENLDIEYAVRQVEKVKCLYHYMDVADYERKVISVEHNNLVTELSKEKYTDIDNEISRIYGVNEVCETPDVSDLKRVMIEYTYFSDMYKGSAEFYLSDDRIFYLMPNMSGDVIQWYEFTPDKCCNLDKINQLLTN